MTDVFAIPIATAQRGVRRRLIKILSEQFPGTLDELYSRDADDVTDSGDGVVLPDPSFYWRQGDPDEATDAGPEHIACFVGQSGASELVTRYTGGSEGYYAQVRTPYVVSIVFGEAMQMPPTTEWAQGEAQSGDLDRALRPEEIMYERADMYLAALQHVLAEYGCRDPGIYKIEPVSGYPDVRTHRIGKTKTRLATVWYGFDVYQWQLWPKHETLP